MMVAHQIVVKLIMLICIDMESTFQIDDRLCKVMYYVLCKIFNTLFCRLSLEWNNLGMHPESFTSFCGALANNSTVQHLDLRSNQLGAESAPALSQGLMRNCGLLSLGEH